MTLVSCGEGHGKRGRREDKRESKTKDSKRKGEGSGVRQTARKKSGGISDRGCNAA